MAKLRVGFRITWVDERGIEQSAYKQSVESASVFGKQLYHRGCREIKISATPQSVPRRERAK